MSPSFSHRARLFQLLLILILGVFAAVIWQRNTIRAHWWAWKLQHTKDPADRGYYLACLASVGPEADGAIEGLSRGSDAELRLLSIYPLQSSMSKARVAVLARLLRDQNKDVRESAGVALVFSDDEAALQTLCDAMKENDASIAANAISACGRSRLPHALDCLRSALRHSEPRARAQAVESIVDQLTIDTQDPGKFFGDQGLVESLVKMTADQGVFEGLLALESEVEGAGRFLHRTKGLSTTWPTPRERSVAEFVREKLGSACDVRIPATKGPLDDHSVREIAEQVRSGLRGKRTLTTSPRTPTTLP